MIISTDLIFCLLVRNCLSSDPGHYRIYKALLWPGLPATLNSLGSLIEVTGSRLFWDVFDQFLPD
jgi:hypothetical protein